MSFSEILLFIGGASENLNTSTPYKKGDLKEGGLKEGGLKSYFKTTLDANDPKMVK